MNTTIDTSCRPLLCRMAILLTTFSALLCSGHAQSNPLPATSAAVSLGAYQEVSRGPHSRVMQRITALTNATGRVHYRTNSYTELATGLSVWRNGRWAPANDQIQLTADGAVGTNSAHQVKFSANLNSAGAIDLLTPEGHHMTSDIAGLVYFDGANNVVIAKPQDSIGQVLPSLNQVLYTNAFAGLHADVLYNHTLSGFEQNIVLRQQLPSPASYGLTGSNVWLQVWTEFTAAPTPQITSSRGGGSCLDFGVMKMEQGRAFSMGGASNSVPVTKQWTSSGGRTFLIESVPLNAIAANLEQLPPGSTSPGSSNSAPGFSPSGDQSKLRRSQSLLASSSPPPQLFDRIVLPARKAAKRTTSPMRLASTAPIQEGVVLDYAINGSITNFTFQSDTTYYASGQLNLYGTTTLEGGSVIKNGQPIAEGTVVYGNFVCRTSPYRPAIFTCTNDDTVGDPISGSTGIPAVVQGNEHFYLKNSGTISNVRFSYAWNAFGCEAPDMEIWDCQFIDCNQPISVQSYQTNVGIHNVLITMEDQINNVTNYCGCNPGGIFFYENSTVNVYCEHLTANVQSQKYMAFYIVSDPGAATISLTNCIIVSPTLSPPFQDGTTTGATVASNAVYYTSTLPGNLFQTVGAGNYYLANNSPLRNAGSPSISPALIADLAQKTTYPPLWLTPTAP